MKHFILLLCLTCVCLLTRQLPGQDDSITDPWNSTEARQFDFWIGTWDVNLRMIQPDKTWKDSVAAKVEIYPILDGKAILELWDSNSIKGFSLRYYDPAQKKWVLYLNWPSNSQSSIGSLKGEFRHGRGEFFAGRGNQLSRYTFCDISPTSLRWDDAFSKDGGKTWTNNWIMEFSRTAERATWPTGTDAHTWNSGGRCRGEEFDRINALAGRWKGEIDFGDEGLPKIPATMAVYRILDGCSVIRFLEFTWDGTTYRNFGLLSWNATRGEFAELRLDNQPNTTADIYRGKPEEDSISVTVEFERDGKPMARRHQWSVDNEKLRLVASEKSGESPWQDMTIGNFTRINEDETTPGEESSTDPKEGNSKIESSEGVTTMDPINSVCPRSGKPVSSDSLTTYRGHVVGFCNTKCRDDFAANVKDRESDRKFFDDIIADKQ